MFERMYNWVQILATGIVTVERETPFPHTPGFRRTLLTQKTAWREKSMQIYFMRTQRPGEMFCPKLLCCRIGEKQALVEKWHRPQESLMVAEIRAFPSSNCGKDSSHRRTSHLLQKPLNPYRYWGTNPSFEPETVRYPLFFSDHLF